MRTVLSLTLAAALLGLSQSSSTGGLLITGGTVIDGTGAPGRRVAVRIRGDEIADVAASLTPEGGEAVIDASGLIVAPGFIDVHSHADRGVEGSPEALSQVLQGITTAVVGQDGGGSLPVSSFFETIARVRPAINYATSVGHGSVRSLVLGGDFRRAATAREIETMKALVDRGMLDGALGLSSGLEYDPGFYARPEELVELARVAARHGGFYSSHVRDEENEVFEAWREAIDVGRKAGLPVQISHIKLASKPVWGRAREALALLEQARAEGITVMADWYPYRYWQSSIYVLIPDRDFENREKWETGLAEIGGAGNVLVTGYRHDPAFNGKTIAELASAAGKDPATLIIEMIRSAGPGIGIIGTAMIESDLETLFPHPQILISSDGGIAGRHPRGYGAFPRVLARYVRERRLVPLHEAIAKMTGRSARQVGLTDRGEIVRGRKADIVVFDAAKIQDLAAPQEPAQTSVGIRHVIVNGERVLEDGALTAARPGRALKPRRATSR
ncbi:MAG TPA: D-aminoacylase [Vicinamibacterales bacterium]|nr:D-aminoacylase [Vicinamibacterales bacterium]